MTKLIPMNLKWLSILMLIFLLACGGETGPSATIQLSSSSLSLTSVVFSESFTIRNMSQDGTVLTWSASTKSDLIRIEPDSGSILDGESQRVIVTLASNWESLEREDDVVVKIIFNGGEKDLAVQVPPPSPPAAARMTLSNGTIALTKDRPAATMQIRNEGDDSSVLDWSALSESELISIQPSEGRLEAGESETLTIIADSTAIDANTSIVNSIRFDSNGGIKVLWTSLLLEGSGLAACGTYPSSEGTALQSHTRALRNGAQELLVKYREPFASQSLNVTQRLTSLRSLESSLQTRYQFKLIKAASTHRPSLIEVPFGQDVNLFAEQLLQDPNVLYAEPNYLLTTLATPNDPLYAEQWNLSEFGLPEAWEVESRGSNVVLAIIDSGVDMTHEDLIDKMLPGCDFNGDDNDPNPGLPNGGKSEHGTHVAGIAAASGNNELGIAGVAYSSAIQILPIKVFDDRGITGRVDDLVDAILWAAGVPLEGVAPNLKPAQIINMSLGVDPAAIPDKLQALSEAIATAKNNGAVLFAASGNAGQSDLVLAPANDPNVIAVGSVDANLERSSFSNYNTNGPSVDFMAPGGVTTAFTCNGTSEVLSTYPKTSEYGCLRGTSMASPFAAGVAALMLSQNSALSPDQIKAALKASAFYDDASMTPSIYGNGIICADRALGASTQCGK